MSDAIPCPRCGAGTRFLLTPRDRTGTGRAAVRLCASRICGVGLTDPPPGAAPAAPSTGPAPWGVDLVAARVVTGGMRRLAARLPRGALVVDVGAGSGLRARALAALGCRVVAIEPDPVEEMRAHVAVSSLPAGAVEVVRADISDLPAVMGGRVAHAAVLWHVLEHLPDMDAGLRTVASVLCPAGLLNIAVPNRASAEAQAFGPRWHGWEPARHWWHLDEDSLRLVLGASGFAVAEIGTRGGWGYPAGIAYSVAPGLDPQVNPRGGLAGRALAALLIPVAAGARAVGRGGQLVTVARRAPG